MQIRLDRALGTTTPDIVYRGEHHDPDEGVCVYLDGLSARLHGDPGRAARDREIRSWLSQHGYEVIEIAVSDLSDEEAMVRHFRKLAGYLGAQELRQRVRSDRSWYGEAATPDAVERRTRLRKVEPRPEERYVTCVPLVPLEVAAGEFGGDQAAPALEECEWVELDVSTPIRQGMFVARVAGKSMEPRIPDGSYCLFASPVIGSRQGRIVLAQLHEGADPETGNRYTVKRYRSEKAESEDSTWRHLRITLEPLSPDFGPLVHTVEDEGQLHVAAEFLTVLHNDPGPSRQSGPAPPTS